ncbi:MAG: hypothetical protein K6F17_03455 [Lachnospiraceae bacterium]|nr:hypothetical protein [Lachnospiraceae bacterium]
METDLKKGIIEINGEVFKPGYTFEEFQKSAYYKDQDGILAIYLDDTFQIGENEFLASLVFENGVLRMISLCCDDIELSWDDELERKKIHDDILKKHGLHPRTVFDWGEIESNFDPKGYCCNILIVYNARRQYRSKKYYFDAISDDKKDAHGFGKEVCLIARDRIRRASLAVRDLKSKNFLIHMNGGIFG